MKKIPTQHLPLSPLHKKLRDVWHGEECKLPVIVGCPGGVWGRGCRFVDACSGEGIFGDREAFYEGAVFKGEGGGGADAFVVREDVGAGDVEEGEDAEEVGGDGFGGVVVGAGDGGGAAAAEVAGEQVSTASCGEF